MYFAPLIYIIIQGRCSHGIVSKGLVDRQCNYEISSQEFAEEVDHSRITFFNRFIEVSAQKNRRMSENVSLSNGL